MLSKRTPASCLQGCDWHMSDRVLPVLNSRSVCAVHCRWLGTPVVRGTCHRTGRHQHAPVVEGDDRFARARLTRIPPASANVIFFLTQMASLHTLAPNVYSHAIQPIRSCGWHRPGGMPMKHISIFLPISDPGRRSLHAPPQFLDRTQ